LGSANITPSPGHLVPDRDNVWTINGANGLVLKDGYHFQAVMGYRIIAHESGYRVTTLYYRYRIACVGDELALIHWHPRGNSGYELPHVHLPQLKNGTEHLPTGRLTFEDAVEWMIQMSHQSARDDWPSVLGDSRAVHQEHRSWSTSPAEAGIV